MFDSGITTLNLAVTGKPDEFASPGTTVSYIGESDSLRDRLKNQVALDVWRAYQNQTTATQSLRTTVDLVASAEQSERVALGRYKAGVGNVLDLLSAQSALASARLQRIQAALDWYVSRATLAQSVGTLDYSLLQPPAQGTP